MLPRSDDPLPANTIRFSEAFELFYQSTEPRWQEIDARIVATSDRLNEAPPEPVELTADGRLPFLGTGTLTDRHRLAIAKAEAISAWVAAHSDAWTRWRAHLAAGDFDPRIRDPRTGEALCPDRAGWNCNPGLGPRGWVVEDFVCPDDPWQPGPMAAIDGFLRPLFFFRDVFEAQPKGLTQPAEQKRRGKKPIYDRARIQEIVLAAIDGFLRPLFFFRDVFEAQPKRLTQPAEQKRRGKKPIYDRACIQEIVFEKMDYHGEFDVADPDWKCQADLERAVLAELGDKGIAPAESTIRELIAKPLKDWRISRASQCR
jgi:hypothetical protein